MAEAIDRPIMGFSRTLWLVAAMPLILAITAIPVLLQLPPDFMLHNMHRFLSTPVILAEAIIVLIASRSGIRVTAGLGRMPGWAKATFLLLIAIILGTDLFVAAQPFSAFFRTVTWGIHLLFGCTVFELARRHWSADPARVWRSMAVAFLAFVVLMWVYIPLAPGDWDFDDWTYFGFGVINIRQLSGLSAGGFALALGAAMIAENKREHIFLVAVAACMMALSAWTGGRTAIFASLCAVALAVVAAPAARTMRALLAIFLAVLGGLAFALLWPVPEPDLMSFSRMFSATATETLAQKGDGRTAIWKLTIPVILERPFFGYGEGQFISTSASMNRLFMQPHNAFLQFAVSWGLVGAACFFALNGRVAWGIFRSIGYNPSAVPALMTAGAVFAVSMLDGALYDPYTISLAATALALGLGFARAIRPVGEMPNNGSGQTPATA